MDVKIFLIASEWGSVTAQFVFLPKPNLMKSMFLSVFTLVVSVAYTQPRQVSQAIIYTTTLIVSPEPDENPGNNPATGPGGEEIRIMRLGGDGETKTTTWLKGDMVKTFSESEMGRTTLIRDNGKKITTTIMEMMGKKTAFYVTDSDQVVIRKKMDSMMKERRTSDLAASPDNASTSDIAYAEGTKKISGFTCSKAFMITTRANGKKDSSVIWFTPDFVLQGIKSTGGSLGGVMGFGSQPANSSAIEKLVGFPIQYERNMSRGRKMTVTVTKVVADKEIASKEFDIPRDIQLKSMKDMQGMMGGPGGGFQIRMGN